MRCLIYARVSRDESGLGRSVEEQEQELRAWAGREGWTVVDVVSETASASRFARSERAAWARVMKAIESGAIDAVLTWEASRAQRDLAAYSALRDACLTHGVLWGYSGRLYDFTDRDARFRTGLDALLAEDEAARTSERVRRAVRANAERGHVHGRNLYGYQRIYDPVTGVRVSVDEHPEHGRVVREIASRLEKGESAYSIAGDLNRRGVPPRTAQAAKTTGWTSVAISEIGRNPGYTGKRVFRGHVLEVQAEWPVLINEDAWERIQQQLDARPRKSVTDFHTRYLLSGLARCGVCASRLVKGHQNRGRPKPGEPRQQYDVYYCKSPRLGERTGHVSVSLKSLDDLITDITVARLRQPDALDAIGAGDAERDARRADLREAIAADRAYLEEVGRQAAQKRDVALLVTQESLVRPRLEAAERELRSLVSADPILVEMASVGDVAATWVALSLEEKRRVIGALMIPVVHRAEKPGRRGRVHERVRIEWLG